jgi:hypothetical protein
MGNGFAGKRISCPKCRAAISVPFSPSVVARQAATAIQPDEIEPEPQPFPPAAFQPRLDSSWMGGPVGANHPYKYHWACPKCATRLELKMRVTQTKRKCPHCGHPITPEDIDLQEAERIAEEAIRKAEEDRLFAERVKAFNARLSNAFNHAFTILKRAVLVFAIITVMVMIVAVIANRK